MQLFANTKALPTLPKLIREVTATFLPSMKSIPGYIDYYFVDVGDAGGRMVSVSVFETETGTAESNQRAADWVRDHPGLVPPATSVEVGTWSLAADG